MLLISFALFVVLGTASLLVRDISKECKKNPHTFLCENEHLTTVCYPGGDSKNVDFNAPCNVNQYVLYSCLYGVKPNITHHGIDIDADHNDAYVSNSTQRLCLCEGQFWDTFKGCNSCYRKHGGGNQIRGELPADVIDSMSQAYCAATATPTLGYPYFVFEYLGKPSLQTLFTASSVSGSPSVTYSDPLASSTAVSLYYTAAVPVSEALNVGVFTETGTAKQTTKMIKNGQIIATASTSSEITTTTSMQTAEETTQAVSSSASTTTESGIGSRQTQAGYAGVLGLVGVAALLKAG